jgi:predicted patatin/cPLA2 family phospholipase
MLPKSKTALVVEGDAWRGIFSTGVLDGFLESGFNPFDFFLGVSSGACNLAAYLAEMPKRNFLIYTDYSLRPEFISFKRFFSGGHLLDLDWLWEKTISEMRLDLKTIYDRKKPLTACLTDVQTGNAVYKKTNAGNLESVLKASSALPVLYRAFPAIDGHMTTDGGISDPIPIKKAIDMGARKIMVIRSRPKYYQKKESFSQAALLWKLRSYPCLRQTILGRVKRYNESVSLIRKPPRGVDIVEICPPDNFRPGRLVRNKTILMEGYDQGRMMAVNALRFWGEYEN